jgi:hypothetical protein
VTVVNFDTDAIPDDLRKHTLDMVLSSRRYRFGDQLSTVGLPLYLATPEEYAEGIDGRNADQMEAHADLYDFVARRLGQFLGAEASYDPQMALPGFHVIESSAKKPFKGGAWHTDIFPAHKASSEFSFTLLLGDDTGPFMLDVDGGHSIVSYMHRPGRLSILESAARHKISPFHGDRVRVTLQGHAMQTPSGYKLFW